VVEPIAVGHEILEQLIHSDSRGSHPGNPLVNTNPHHEVDFIVRIRVFNIDGVDLLLGFLREGELIHLVLHSTHQLGTHLSIGFSQSVVDRHKRVRRDPGNF
jgi:hypothetical protein